MAYEGVVCSKNFLTKFIEIYKQHPALWKIKSKDYTNKHLKKKGYDALIEYSKPFYPDADRNFVCKKIQNLRGCFRKEMRRVEASQRSGIGADDMYEPHLWYFELLMFTTDQEMPVKSNDSENFEDISQCTDFTENEYTEVEEGQNVSEETQGSPANNLHIGKQGEEIQNLDDVTQDSSRNDSQAVFKKPVIPSKQGTKVSAGNQKRSYYVMQQQHQEFMKTCTEVLNLKENTVDEFDAVGINVASKLKKMSPSQQVLAEGLINKILMKGIFKELTRTTDISDVFVSRNSYMYDQSSSASTSTPSPMTSPESNFPAIAQYYTNVGTNLESEPF